MNKQTTDVIIRKVDKAEWMAFRAMCLQEGVSATEKLKRMIATQVQKPKQK